MSYQTTAEGTCDQCGSHELVLAADELAAAPGADFDDLAECLSCGAFVELDGRPR